MQIDIKLLAKNFIAAEQNDMSFPPDVPEYLITHVYEPLQRNEVVYFDDLDFSAFSTEDINAFRNMLEEKEGVYCTVSRIISHFCEAPPVSTKTRAFC